MKSELSEYLRRVKAGEPCTLKERRRLIGQIIPGKTVLAHRMQAMVAAGAALWTGQKLGPYQPRVANTGEHQLSDLVLEDRG